MNGGQLQTEVSFRDRESNDVAFITSSYVGAAQHLKCYKGLDTRVRTHHLHAFIARAWRDPLAVWLVAAYPKNMDFNFGWLLGHASDAGPVLHWIYVRDDMRRFGVGSALYREFMRGQDASKLIVTSVTPHWKRFHEGSAACAGSLYLNDPWVGPWSGVPFTGKANDAKAKR